MLAAEVHQIVKPPEVALADVAVICEADDAAPEPVVGGLPERAFERVPLDRNGGKPCGDRRLRLLPVEHVMTGIRRNQLPRPKRAKEIGFASVHPLGHVPSCNVPNYTRQGIRRIWGRGVSGRGPSRRSDRQPSDASRQTRRSFFSARLFRSKLTICHYEPISRRLHTRFGRRPLGSCNPATTYAGAVALWLGQC